MADAALLLAMGAMKIQEKNASSILQQDMEHHILSMEYPDFSLMQLQEMPKLTPPANVKYRMKPPQNREELALYDTDFEIALPLSNVPVNMSDNSSTEHMRLFAAVEKLKRSAGEKELSVVRVHNQIWDQITYRVHLQTQWLGSFSPPQNFDLSEAEWTALMSYVTRKSWIELLEHLASRASAKAYYHVQDAIHAEYGQEDVQREKAGWQVQWNTILTLSLEQHRMARFLDRLNMQHANIAANLGPHFLLPCGHGWHLDSESTMRFAK